MFPTESAGVIVRPAPGVVLLCHATLRRYWDLPKGQREQGEPAQAAAQRELEEETGICAPQSTLVDLGRHAYRPGKALQVFLLDAQTLAIELQKLRCVSTFFDPKSKRNLPEVDAYRWVQRGELAQFCTTNMRRVLESLEW